MENIIKKEALCNITNNIEISYGKRLTTILLLLVAIAVLILSRRFYESESASTLLLTAGIVLLVVAVVKLFMPSKVMRYKPSGEKITMQTLHHPIETAKEVERALRSGDLEYVTSLASKDNAPLMTIVYTTPSRRFVAGQSLKYVPYEYVPLFEAVVTEK